MTTYRIIRCYLKDGNRPRTVKRGLTLEQAQSHCRSPETSSRTATSFVARRRTKTSGPWFDAYDEDR